MMLSLVEPSSPDSACSELPNPSFSRSPHYICELPQLVWLPKLHIPYQLTKASYSISASKAANLAGEHRSTIFPPDQVGLVLPQNLLC
ncbi:hypothetical protein Tco_1331936 [Tanacetum coccineum]